LFSKLLLRLDWLAQAGTGRKIFRPAIFEETALSKGKNFDEP